MSAAKNQLQKELRDAQIQLNDVTQRYNDMVLSQFEAAQAESTPQITPRCSNGQQQHHHHHHYQNSSHDSAIDATGSDIAGTADVCQSSATSSNGEHVSYHEVQLPPLAALRSGTTSLPPANEIEIEHPFLVASSKFAQLHRHDRIVEIDNKPLATTMNLRDVHKLLFGGNKPRTVVVKRVYRATTVSLCWFVIAR